jgi:hypothetical protein
MGLIVGLGAIAHDICDGMNTILLATGGRRPRRSDYGFLALDALAPIAGGLIAALSVLDFPNARNGISESRGWIVSFHRSV